MLNTRFRQIHLVYLLKISQKLPAEGTGHICSLSRSGLPLTEFRPVWPGYNYLGVNSGGIWIKKVTKLVAPCQFFGEHTVRFWGEIKQIFLVMAL